MADATGEGQALLGAPGIPRDDQGPVFAAPWEAQAFAMALALEERGVFSWTEWSATLGEAIASAQAAGDPDTGQTYFSHWLSALEVLVVAKGLVAPEALASYHDAWARAAERTPHGSPIELTPKDFSP